MGAAKEGPVPVTPNNADILHTNYEILKSELPEGVKMRKLLNANLIEAEKKLFEMGVQEKKESNGQCKVELSTDDGNTAPTVKL